MAHQISLTELRELIKAGKNQTILSFISANHPVEVAELILQLSPEEAWHVLKQTDPHLSAEIFSHFDREYQIDMVDVLTRNEAAKLISEMPPDDRASLFKRMPEEKKEIVLPALARAEREDVRRLTSYAEETAGAVMTSDYATLSPIMTISQAIEHLREVAPDTETIYYAYVLGAHRKLNGFVSLKDLILARRDARVEQIMHADVISARVDDDQEDVARRIQKYDLLALPVINKNGALVGIITHDDAIDIITQEHTEDMEKFMAISGSHADAMYMKTPVWEQFKNRFPWVIALAVLGLVSGFIVQRFEGLLVQFTILAAFMPMLADTGGNTGSQSATLVVRALALKEISPKDILRILAKEFQVAVMLAFLLGAIAFVRVMFFGDGTSIPDSFSLLRIGFAISIALGLQVITATLIGAILPLGAARMKWDPAIVASPALTTIVDITGLIIYFMTVKLLLDI